MSPMLTVSCRAGDFSRYPVERTERAFVPGLHARSRLAGLGCAVSGAVAAARSLHAMPAVRAATATVAIVVRSKFVINVTDRE